MRAPASRHRGPVARADERARADRVGNDAAYDSAAGGAADRLDDLGAVTVAEPDVERQVDRARCRIDVAITIISIAASASGATCAVLPVDTDHRLAASQVRKAPAVAGDIALRSTLAARMAVELHRCHESRRWKGGGDPRFTEQQVQDGPDARQSNQEAEATPLAHKPRVLPGGSSGRRPRDE